jgi:hypothetical protein
MSEDDISWRALESVLDAATGYAAEGIGHLGDAIRALSQYSLRDSLTARAYSRLDDPDQCEPTGDEALPSNIHQQQRSDETHELWGQPTVFARLPQNTITTKAKSIKGIQEPGLGRSRERKLL